jgi:fatty acid desaturase
MRPRLDHLAAHLLRLAVAAAALVLLPPAWRAPLAAAVFLAAFCLAHDLAHGALRLPRRANELALSLAGLAMLTSGHAMRVAHLRHHAAPLGHDDF